MTTIVVKVVTKTDGTATVTVTTTVDGVEGPATSLNLTAGQPEPK